MKRSTVFIFLLLISQYAFCQNRGNIWCFGDSSLINFSTQPPTTGSSSIRTRGTACSISDSNGNLLFYCGSPHISLWQAGGVYFLGVVYNRNGDIMENGDTLAGEGWYDEMIIVPCPLNSNQFYLLQIEEGNQAPGLYYSIIDMTFNGGLGKVISKNNQILSGTMAFGITAVKNGNGRDWWAIARKSLFFSAGPADNDFYVIKVDSNGISLMPVQSIGSFNSTNGAAMRFNATGDKFVFVNWKGLVELYDFDRCTGLIINSVNIDPEASSNYPLVISADFSPSGQYLYTSVSLPVSNIYQYNLNAPIIHYSRKTIFTDTTTINCGGALKLAPDKKIYYSFAWDNGLGGFNFPYPDSVYNSINMNLGVINLPDIGDSLCNFQPFSFYLGGNRTYYGLPNNPDYDLGPLVGSPCDTLNLGINEDLANHFAISVYPNPAVDNIHFTFTNKSGTLLICDATGRIVRKYNFENGNVVAINLEAGIYSAQLFEKSNLISVAKFIVTM